MVLQATAGPAPRFPTTSGPMIDLSDVKAHPAVKTFIRLADLNLGEIGYTEHGFRHAKIVSRDARKLLKGLGYSDREPERAAIAGYLHDLGNFVSRKGHPQTGASICYPILTELGMPYREVGIVLGAIGNHEEGDGLPVSPEGAALILADKSDVHRSRVRNKVPETFDIHDRVNFAAESSILSVDLEERTLILELRIDTTISKIMEYFEIFLDRMTMCRRAAEFLHCRFRLVINGQDLL
jgi:metal-dependent HD superfamily phosphatase/phosphodiesterase